MAPRPGPWARGSRPPRFPVAPFPRARTPPRPSPARRRRGRRLAGGRGRGGVKRRLWGAPGGRVAVVLASLSCRGAALGPGPVAPIVIALAAGPLSSVRPAEAFGAGLDGVERGGV